MHCKQCGVRTEDAREEEVFWKHFRKCSWMLLSLLAICFIVHNLYHIISYRLLTFGKEILKKSSSLSGLQKSRLCNNWSPQQRLFVPFKSWGRIAPFLVTAIIKVAKLNCSHFSILTGMVMGVPWSRTTLKSLNRSAINLEICYQVLDWATDTLFLSLSDEILLWLTGKVHRKNLANVFSPQISYSMISSN